MSLFKKLFGGSGSPSEPQVELYEGFRIIPDPIKESGGYRLAARIEKEVEGEVKSHLMVRADVCHSAEEAASAATFKARSLIDQMGDRIF